MSALGHERTSRRIRVMTVLPLKADIHQPESAPSRHDGTRLAQRLRAA